MVLIVATGLIICLGITGITLGEVETTAAALQEMLNTML